MYRRIGETFDEPLTGKILGISGIDAFYSLISKEAEVLDVHYPKIDMQNLPCKDDSFDLVISDQVIEHLENPKKSIIGIAQGFKKGGVAIHTTCFINYIHPCPKDYWCFSPEALKYLCSDFSEVLCCGGWGSRIAFFLCSISNKLRFMQIPDSHWCLRHMIAMYNEEKYPIVTWVVAKK